MALLFRKSNDYGRALLLVAQAPRWRSLFLACVLLIAACWTWRASEAAFSHASFSWSRNTSSHGEEEALHPAYLRPSNITIGLESGKNQSVPPLLKKENPQFHLLIHAPKINAGVCRCILSSYILDYPPPTLVGYHPPLDPLAPQSVMADDEVDEKNQNGIPDVADYLNNERRIKDNDAVLVVDGATTLFQLPSEALLTRFAGETRERNIKLARGYPEIKLQSPQGDYIVQHFNQSVFFASSRENITIPAGPKTTDFLGRKIQTPPETRVENTLNDAAIIGTAQALGRVFKSANRANKQVTRADKPTFRTMLAQQARTRMGVFEPLRQRRSIWGIWKLWLTLQFSVDAAVRAEEDKEARAAAVRDLGMGLDDQSRMMFSIPPPTSVSDSIEASPSSSSSPASRIGFVLGANESDTVVLPKVLMQEKARGPFAMHPFHLHLNSSSLASKSKQRDTSVTPEPELPSPQKTGWDQIPLVLDPRTGNVPSLISSEAGIDAGDVYHKLWFKPYARTLLNQYLTRSRSKEIASEAAVGGGRWWDSRGGRGGVWTTLGEWIDAGDLCDGFSADVFGDGGQVWELERRATEMPVADVRVLAVAKEVAEKMKKEGEERKQQEQQGQQTNGEEGGQAEGSQSIGQQAGEQQQTQTPPETAKGNAEAKQSIDTPKSEETRKQDGKQAKKEVAGNTNVMQAGMPVAIMPDGTERALSDFGDASGSSPSTAGLQVDGSAVS